MSDKTKNGRDINGRWAKGHCPNPNGRPRKEPPTSGSDVRHFKQTRVKATMYGEAVELTRHELLLHKMFENALKGSILAQRKLFERFEQSDNTIAEAEFHLRWLGRQICDKHNKTGKFDEDLYEEYCRYYLLIYGRPHYEAVNEASPRSRRRAKTQSDAATWRTGPKPQFVLDLEKEWAEAEAAEEAARAARAKSQPKSPDDPEDA